MSSFYLFYFAALGAFLPFWSLFLQAEGFTPAQIGELMALLAATKLVSPMLWGWVADHVDRSMALVRFASFLTAAGFFWFGEISGYHWMIAVTVLVGMFWNAPLPLFEAVTLAYLHADSHRYSRIRLWGSIGFVTAVLVVGQILGSRLVIECLPGLIFILLLVMSLTSLTIPERSVRIHDAASGSLWNVLRQSRVMALFVVFMLIQVAHGPYYVFFSVYLKANGFDSTQTGQLWAVGILAEILLFLGLHHVLSRFSMRAVLLWSIALGIVRWLLIAWCVKDVVALLIAQSLHAVTFGSSHVVAIQLIHKYFGGRHHSKGQALYTSVSYGLGGMLGSYYSGMMWDGLGPEMVYSVAAGASLMAWLIAWIWAEKIPRPRGLDGSSGFAYSSDA